MQPYWNLPPLLILEAWGPLLVLLQLQHPMCCLRLKPSMSLSSSDFEVCVSFDKYISQNFCRSIERRRRQ